MSTPLMANDKRPIHEVRTSEGVNTVYGVGRCGVTKIECYPEKGPYDYVPMLAVYHGEHLAIRAPALNFMVVYAEPPVECSEGEKRAD